MTLDELKQFSATIEQDVFEVLTLEGSVAARNHIGGTAPTRCALLPNAPVKPWRR